MLQLFSITDITRKFKKIRSDVKVLVPDEAARKPRLEMWIDIVA